MKNIVFDFYKVIYNPKKGEINEDILITIKSLHNLNIPLHIFTNSSLQSLEKRDQGTPFLHYFENIFHDLSKPQPESFKMLIEQLGVNASEILLIDDRDIVVQRAQQCGIKTVKYTPGVDLEKHIQEFLGISLEK